MPSVLISRWHSFARYGNDGLSTKAIERVVELAALNPWAVKANYGNLSYRDFVCFMLSEEDKLSPRGVYVRCLIPPATL